MQLDTPSTVIIQTIKQCNKQTHTSHFVPRFLSSSGLAICFKHHPHSKSRLHKHSFIFVFAEVPPQSNKLRNRTVMFTQCISLSFNKSVLGAHNGPCSVQWARDAGQSPCPHGILRLGLQTLHSHTLGWPGHAGNQRGSAGQRPSDKTAMYTVAAATSVTNITEIMLNISTLYVSLCASLHFCKVSVHLFHGTKEKTKKVTCLTSHG